MILGSSSPNVWILGRGYRRSSDLGAFLKLGIVILSGSSPNVRILSGVKPDL